MAARLGGASDNRGAGATEISYGNALAALEQMARDARSCGVKLGRGAATELGSGAASAAQLRYRALVEQVPAVTFIAALDEATGHQELYVSPQIEALLGFTQEQWLADPFLWYRQLHPDDRAAWGEAFARTCATGVNFRSEYRLIACDGRVVWVHGECRLISDDRGQPLFLLGIAFDVTERKVAEQRLQESNRALQQAVRSEHQAHRELQRAQAELTEINRTLEDRVKQRTTELEEAHVRLLRVARQAGMAEVATDVLHNVGNVLNSVNVRSTLVRDKVKASRVTGLDRVCRLLEEHERELPQFLTSDEQGRFLPQYLKTLARHLLAEREGLLTELDALRGHVEHMKQLIVSQQAHARDSVMTEPTDVGRLVREAIEINYAALARYAVSVRQEVPNAWPPLPLDRHRVLQVLINLIANAAQACADLPERDQRIVRVTARQDEGKLEFEVTDNGVGIPPENLTRIFAHGFTTRPQGHGFGLHSCANAAREMGGSLVAASKGPGRGATFTLRVPVAHT
jgi:PAS domain S-box-containing protein